MATNPQGPFQTREPRKGPELVPGQPKKPVTAVPGVLLAIVVAAALIAAIVYYMPRAPKITPGPTGGQAPTQPIANGLQFSNLHMTQGPQGEMTLDGLVLNEGPRPVLGVTAQLTFLGNDGKVLQTVNQPLQGMMVQNQGLVPDNWSVHPLRPNQQAPFRVNVAHTPAGWNHQFPAMKLITVGSEGSR